MMTKDFFENNVIVAVEVEYDMGGRCWHTMKGSEVREYCDRVEQAGDSISDIDYCTKQNNAWCRKVLNAAYKNFYDNRDWCRKWGLKSLDDVIDFIIDNKLVA